MIQGQVNAARQAVLGLQLPEPGGTSIVVQAAIDTGFDGFLALPPHLVAALALPFLETRNYELADGNVVPFPIHQVTIVWNGQSRDVEALITDGGALVGMSLLYGYHLFIDVIDGGEVKIQPRPGP